MKAFLPRRIIYCAAYIGVLATVALTPIAASGDIASTREKANKDYKSGNWKDALGGFRELLSDKNNNDPAIVSDLTNAYQCLNRLGLISETDQLLEVSVASHPKNWRLIQAVAQKYLNSQHQGFMISGEYRRGPHRGGGKVVNSYERDRVRALQLYEQATPLAQNDDAKSEVASFFLNFANALLYNRGYSQSWRLQVQTDLGELPDYAEGYASYRGTNGAPVDEAGNPVFHSAPKQWGQSKTDGERWRWALEQVSENSPDMLNQVRWQLAQFSYNQFGVQTARYGGFRPRFFGLEQTEDGEKTESTTYEIHTLKENETIAKLATGVKRFELPDEFNFIKIMQKIAAEPKTGYGENALNQLAEIFANRRQYPKSADYWKQSIEQYGPGNRDYKKKRVEQITGNWGQFETIRSQPAGDGATVEFRFRNAKKVEYTAHAIKVDNLLKDVQKYLENNPGQRLDYRQLQISNIGYRLVSQGDAQYVGNEVARWSQKLEPRENHYDRRITVQTPLKKPGAYLVTAKVEGGNEVKIVMWVADTAIVHKRLDKANLYYVADAVNGTPLANAEVEFFGYQRKHLGNGKWQVLTKKFTDVSDGNGQIIPDTRDLVNGYQWLLTLKTKQGRFAYLGFQNVWNANYHDQEYRTVKIFTITDRPVYRPDQKVFFKSWVRHAQYDKEDVSQFAGVTVPVEIRNPKNEKIYEQTLTADEYGGIQGEFTLPKEATLGQYRIAIRAQENKRLVASGGNSFRVEEYKKPEYEVTIDAPADPVALGDKVKAKITARYYFGAPVVNATVKYKITRNTHEQEWYPSAPWDWCFGPGYWWFAYEARWMPGWGNWVGCRAPAQWWQHRRQNPPEIVAEQEVEIGPEGQVEVEIDTELAKALHGDSDHKYTITAEVRDESRRTIVGTGNVLVARKPFKVFTWVDRGYYRTGQTIEAQFQAKTLDEKPVSGKGVLTLYKITYKGGKVQETPVRRWDVDADDEGKASLQMRASAKGQYRLSYELTDAANHTIEGGYMLTIMGDGFDGSNYRFNNLEIIPDRQDYQAGDKAKIQINTNHAGSTVLLFVRPANGVYLPPEVLKIEGKSVVHEVTISKKDMPNFFVEAVTVYGGQVYRETKEIVVPPEKRILNVAVVPSKKDYKPGEKAKVKVQITDFTGENYQGSAVVSVYDKSVEYISGGSNVPEIKEFFWKWRRRHQPQGQNSLSQYSGSLNLPNQPGMSFLGVFGHSVADDFSTLEEADGAVDEMAEGLSVASNTAGFGGGGARGGIMMSKSRAPMAAMAMADSAAAPGAPPMERAAKSKRAAGGESQSATAGLQQPSVRSNFADTAYWSGEVKTDKTGVAEIEFDMPENLTTWKINVWGIGHGTRVGSGVAEVVTRKNVIVRLQAPRFFVQKDEVVLSANVHNYLKEAKDVTVSLELPGEYLKANGELTKVINVPADGEQRVDWRVKVLREGDAVVRMKALTDEESDAMEVKLPAYVHGMLKTEAWAGTVRPDKELAEVTIEVPEARRPEQSRLEVRYSPSLAGAMVDALPYLADYPYGCTEQTLNRFLPSVITRKTLIDMNLDLAAIQKKRTNLNAQEIGVDVDRAKQWKRFDRNPVFEQEELDNIIKAGVTRLTNMQVGDGGWGWFSGNGARSTPHTTAVVVHGLQRAAAADVELPANMLSRGEAWLVNYQKEQVQLLKNAENNLKPFKSTASNLDAMIYMVLNDAKRDNPAMREYLFRDRNSISVYAKGMFALACEQLGDTEKMQMLKKNIEQYLVEDAENETAYLKLPESSYWWNWYGDETEANAYYLKLLARVQPKGQTAPRLVKYLLNNREHGTYGKSTRDTATCVEAFADYIKATGEASPDMVVEIWVDGKKMKEVEITASNIFSFDNKFVLTGEEVTSGPHTVAIRRKGKGPVYFNTYLTNFTLEDPIKKAGLEVKVERKFYKLTRVEKTEKVAGSRGQAVDQKVEKYKRTQLADGEDLKSGDLVEVELTIDSKNDYEYLLFEDMKAAGFEAVGTQSGYTHNGLRSYTEYRDNRVSFFVERLARGTHSVSYRLRAEIPGKFSALPAKGYAMYAPELKTNSDEMKLGITD